MNHLLELSKKHPDFVGGPRGLGTLGAFNCKDVQTREALIHQLRQLGIQAGPVGDDGIRLRPTLYFEEKHVDIYIDRLDKACKTLSSTVISPPITYVRSNVIDSLS